MNILLVAMEMNIGGAETHILELAYGLKKRGNNVYVVSAGGNYVEILEKNHISHFFAPLKDKKPQHMLRAYMVIKNIIKKYHIDVVHAHARIPGFICGIVCRITHTKLVTTIHGIYRVNFLLKHLTNWGEKTLTVSKDIRDYAIKEYNLNPQNVRLTINGIDTERFSVKSEKSLSNRLDIRFDKEKLKVIHVSRLDKDSSEVAEALIEIAEELDQELEHGVQIIIVGSGDNYEQLILKSVGKGNIILTGARTDVDELLNESDIFVGVSRAALEAMACELPVILAGNYANKQGYEGIFTKDKLKIAQESNFTCRGMDKMKNNVLKNDILKLAKMDRKKLGKYNRSIVEKYYSVDKMVEDAITIYL